MQIVYLVGDPVPAAGIAPPWEIDTIVEPQGRRHDDQGRAGHPYHQDTWGQPRVLGWPDASRCRGAAGALPPRSTPQARASSSGVGSDLVKVDNHDTLPIGRLTLTFMHTPGHTPGSQCFLVDDRLISGDTLFIGSCGRTDLPGSDPSEMYYSLTQRLGALPDQTILFPGHNYGGPASTIGQEKRNNPFMRFTSLGNFLRAMNR